MQRLVMLDGRFSATELGDLSMFQPSPAMLDEIPRRGGTGRSSKCCRSIAGTRSRTMRQCREPKPFPDPVCRRIGSRQGPCLSALELVVGSPWPGGPTSSFDLCGAGAR